MISEHEARAIGERLAGTRDAIADAARRAGRAAEDVSLVAISKFHPAGAVRAAYDAGQRQFGENYIQEALAKQDELTDLDISWHFTGKLQSNKAKFVPCRFDLIHTLESPKLAQALHKRLCTAAAPHQRVLLEVNLAGEEQKAGVMPEALPALAEAVLGYDSLELAGLMLLPPFDLTPEQRRPLFAELRRQRDALETRLNMTLPVLSMGMTDDFPQAIMEGATIVRVGTRIFGPRPTKQ